MSQYSISDSLRNVSWSVLNYDTILVNEQYYTFDVTDLDYKTEIIEKIENS